MIEAILNMVSEQAVQASQSALARSAEPVKRALFGTLLAGLATAAGLVALAAAFALWLISLGLVPAFALLAAALFLFLAAGLAWWFGQGAAAKPAEHMPPAAGAGTVAGVIAQELFDGFVDGLTRPRNTRIDQADDTLHH